MFFSFVYLIPWQQSKGETMTTLFYLHWNEQELKERVKPLKELGLKIYFHWNIQ